jgi:hypothetical protein
MDLNTATEDELIAELNKCETEHLRSFYAGVLTATSIRPMRDKNTILFNVLLTSKLRREELITKIIDCNKIYNKLI